MDAANNSPPRPTTEKQAATNRQGPASDNGQNRTHTPFESPARASSCRPPVPSTPGSTHALLHPPSTPAQNVVHGFAPGTPNRCAATQPNLLRGSSSSSGGILSELNTPVISNANVSYVDDDRDRAGGEGLPPTQPGFVVVAGRGPGNPDMPFGNNKSTDYGMPLSKSLAPRTNSHGRMLGARPPQPFAAKGGGGVGVPTSLAMPGASRYDDSSSDDDAMVRAALPPATAGSVVAVAVPAQESILRPIEWKPDRFHSFQGSAQYERSVPGRNVHFVNAGPPPSDENDGGRRAANLSPAREYPRPAAAHVATASGQYFPTVRGAHGVRELSDTKDLDAIFKADRAAADTTSGPPPSVARSATSSMNPKIVSPMSVDGGDDDDDDDDGEEERRQESSSFHQIGGAIPIDDRQWSIPSIRLANHVSASGLDGSFASHHTLFSDEEDYTDDGGSSFDGSFLGCDDDDLSLSSKESYDQVRRWRRLSGVLRRGGVPPPATASYDEDVVMMPPPHVMRTAPATNSSSDVPDSVPTGGGATGGVSLLEQRFGRIAIEESAVIGPSPLVLDACTPLQSIDDNVVDYHRDAPDGAVRARPHRHRRHKKKGRPRSHSAAALEWIQNLQLSNAIEGSRITEAASSKFLTGAVKKVEPSDLAVSQDATKALGMPHPLCRSTTIEAGGFAYDMGGGGSLVESVMVSMDDGGSR